MSPLSLGDGRGRRFAPSAHSAAAIALPRVPCLWPRQTIVCIAPGPSLTQLDCDAVKGQARVIVVNDAYIRAPWADVLYAGDADWWKSIVHVPDNRLPTSLCSLDPLARQHRPFVTVLVRESGTGGLATAPTSLRTGGHSGYAAINLAVHLVGAGGRIVLLGYDMQPGPSGVHHFFGNHANRTHPRYEKWLPLYDSLTSTLAAREITIVNATRRTAIPARAIPQRPLAELFAAR